VCLVPAPEKVTAWLQRHGSTWEGRLPRKTRRAIGFDECHAITASPGRSVRKQRRDVKRLAEVAGVNELVEVGTASDRCHAGMPAWYLALWCGSMDGLIVSGGVG